MQRKKDENRERAENYDLGGGQTGKEFIQDLSEDILSLRERLRAIRKRIEENKDMPERKNVQDCLTEVYEAIGSLQHGYGGTLSLETKKHEGDTEMESRSWAVHAPIEFEDRVQRVKSAIEEAKKTIKTAEKRDVTGKTSLIKLIFLQITEFFRQSGTMDKLVIKLAAFSSRLGSEGESKADLPLRFFLPKPPEPKVPRLKSEQSGDDLTNKGKNIRKA